MNVGFASSFVQSVSHVIAIRIILRGKQRGVLNKKLVELDQTAAFQSITALKVNMTRNFASDYGRVELV